jgi:hypothetical protein
VVSAEDERHGVEQKNGRLGLVCHGTKFNSSQLSVAFLGVSQVAKSRAARPIPFKASKTHPSS